VLRGPAPASRTFCSRSASSRSASPSARALRRVACQVRDLPQLRNRRHERQGQLSAGGFHHDTLIRTDRGRAGCALSDVSADPGGKAPKKKDSPPNILFVLMDDVGMDQMQIFGYGGAQPPATPNLEEIADAGIRFRNAWSMSACSTSRAAIFEGRYPFLTDVLGALGPSDLANSIVNPYEETVPRLLKTRATRARSSASFTSRCRTTTQRVSAVLMLSAGTTSSATWTTRAIRRRSTGRQVASQRRANPTRAVSFPARTPAAPTPEPATSPTAAVASTRRRRTARRLDALAGQIGMVTSYRGRGVPWAAIARHAEVERESAKRRATLSSTLRRRRTMWTA